MYLKIVITAILVFIISGMWLYDSIRVKEYDINVVYVSNINPPADNDYVVTIVAQVTRNGVPCEGHNMEIRCGENQGRFIVYLDVTDENGYATFKYAPYDEAYKDPGPVEFTLIDQSNSLLVEVDKTVYYNEMVLVSKGGK